MYVISLSKLEILIENIPYNNIYSTNALLENID